MHELEFLPEDYLRARFQRRIGFIRSWLLLAIGMAMVLWSLQVGAWVRDARAELAAVRGAGSAVDADVKKVRSLRAEARSHNKRLELLRSLRPGIAVAEVLAVDRKITAVEPHLAVSDGNWEIEFFNSDRYNAARNHRSP